MPGVSGVTVVTNARVYYSTRAAAGAPGARHSLRPLYCRRRNVVGKTRAKRAARSRRRDCCLKFESQAVVEDEDAEQSIARAQRLVDGASAGLAGGSVCTLQLAAASE